MQTSRPSLMNPLGTRHGQHPREVRPQSAGQGVHTTTLQKSLAHEQHVQHAWLLALHVLHERRGGSSRLPPRVCAISGRRPGISVSDVTKLLLQRTVAAQLFCRLRSSGSAICGRTKHHIFECPAGIGNDLKQTPKLTSGLFSSWGGGRRSAARRGPPGGFETKRVIQNLRILMFVLFYMHFLKLPV